MLSRKESETTTFFNRTWDYVGKSHRYMGPALFHEAGMSWYGNYEPSTIPHLWTNRTARPVKPNPEGKLGVFISAPSNAGKDAITKYVQDHFEGLLCPVVTATDRPPRTEEKEGIDQIFLTPEEFQQWKQDEKFIEASQTRPPYWFGIPKSSVDGSLNCSNVALFRINIDGIRSVKPIIDASYFPSVRIAVIPHITLETYRTELFNSGKEKAQQRFQTAKREMFRFGQRPDNYEYVLENPWEPTGVPAVAGEAFAKLLQSFIQSR